MPSTDTNSVPAIPGAQPVDADTPELLRQLVERLDTLSAKMDRLDRLEPLLELADRLPGIVAMIVDSADEEVRRAGGRGLDVDLAIRGGAGAALRFGAMMGPAQIDSLQALLDSGVLDPRAVRVVAAVGRALSVEAPQAATEPGLLALLRAAREPEVRRALGFLLHVARSFGHDLPMTDDRHRTA